MYKHMSRHLRELRFGVEDLFGEFASSRVNEITSYVRLCGTRRARTRENLGTHPPAVLKYTTRGARKMDWNYTEVVSGWFSLIVSAYLGMR